MQKPTTSDPIRATNQACDLVDASIITKQAEIWRAGVGGREAEAISSDAGRGMSCGGYTGNRATSSRASQSGVGDNTAAPRVGRKKRLRAKRSCRRNIAAALRPHQVREASMSEDAEGQEEQHDVRVGWVWR